MTADSGRLPPEVKGLGAVSLFNDLASEMVYPVLPAFVTGTLGASPLALGALDGAAELTAAALRYGSGRLADRPGWKRPLILAGYATALLVRPLISVASAAWQVVGFRVIDRFGKGLRSPARDALIVSLTRPELRGRAFGFHRGADHLGAVVGSLLAWALLSSGADPRSVIGWSVAPGLVAVVVLVAVLRAVGRKDARAQGREGARALGREDARAEGGADAVGAAFWLPVAVLVWLTVGRLPETLLLLRLQDLGVTPPLVPLAWAGLHVVRSASAYPGGRLADRMGPRVGIAAGTLLYAAAVLGLAGGLSPAAAVAVFLGHGLAAGLSEPAERLAVARLAPVRTGRGFGSFQAMAGVAALPAALGFGALYSALGGRAALLASAGTLAVAIPVWLGLGGRWWEPRAR